MVNSRFFGNSALGMGGAIGGSNSTVRIQNSSFIGNSAQNGGAVQVANNVEGTIHLIETSSFLNNQAESGGAVHVSNSAAFGGTKVSGSVFVHNMVRKSGGAVFFEPSAVSGSFLWLCLNCTFANNTAQGYGNNYASTPYQLIANTSVSLDHVVSPNSSVTVNFQLEDQLGNIVNDSSYAIQLHIDSNSLVVSGSNPSNTWPASGKVSFQVTFGIKVPSDSWKPFNCSLYVISFSSGAPLAGVLPFNFSIKIGDCGLGEQPSGASCQPCLATQYLLDTNNTCQPCPEGKSPCADRSSDDGNYTVLHDFWVLPCLEDPRFLTTCRSSHCLNLTCHRECSQGNRSCITSCHNKDGGLDHCKENYEGNFCSRCRCNLSAGNCSYRDAFGDCTSCHASQTSDVLLFVSIVLAVLVCKCCRV